MWPASSAGPGESSPLPGQRQDATPGQSQFVTWDPESQEIRCGVLFRARVGSGEATYLAVSRCGCIPGLFLYLYSCGPSGMYLALPCRLWIGKGRESARGQRDAASATTSQAGDGQTVVPDNESATSGSVGFWMTWQARLFQERGDLLARFPLS